ncbi:DUF4037 domain-containing protein [Micromonospora sp. NPDC051196]|uniref:DUF4037 domain-containing protein n=1 Tax=Micromonospora sp. NPDC051196 TaxID=3155281 RepID=UPI00342F5374
MRGWSTNFSPPEPGRSRTLRPAGDAPIEHRVEVFDLDVWLATRLGADPRGGMRVRDWLAVPTQRLLEVTSGAVFHDGLGQLEPIRTALAWYPDDVWRYLLASQWRRIAQEESFPGRCTEVGDDLGSRLVTARLVRDLMRLAMLVERRYPPYARRCRRCRSMSAASTSSWTAPTSSPRPSVLVRSAPPCTGRCSPGRRRTSSVCVEVLGTTEDFDTDP